MTEGSQNEFKSWNDVWIYFQEVYERNPTPFNVVFFLFGISLGFIYFLIRWIF